MKAEMMKTQHQNITISIQTRYNIKTVGTTACEMHENCYCDQTTSASCLNNTITEKREEKILSNNFFPFFFFQTEDLFNVTLHK